MVSQAKTRIFTITRLYFQEKNLSVWILPLQNLDKPFNMDRDHCLHTELGQVGFIHSYPNVFFYFGHGSVKTLFYVWEPKNWPG